MINISSRHEDSIALFRNQVITALMKLYFRPLPGLTIVTLIALVILLTLGTWQYQRLQWKTALLAEIEQAVTAPPLTSLADVSRALDRGEPVDFRRIRTEPYMMSGIPFSVFTAENGGVSWRQFLPMQEDRVAAFVDMETVPDDRKDKPYVIGAGPQSYVGYVRKAHPKAWGEAKSSPDQNRWFGFNPMPDTHNWADQVQGDMDMRFYVEVAEGATEAGSLPVRRPDIANNHFDYMLTWYGLAAVLLVIYLIMHRRAGRLGASS